MRSKTRAGLICWGLMVALPVGCFGQKKGKKEKEFPPPAAEILPAEALKFGVAVEEAAPDVVKKWTEALAKGEMRTRPVDPQGTMKTVDERFNQAEETARDVITFLVFYSAYKDEDENYRTLGYRVRDIDRETKEITRELQIIWKNEQTRGASPLQSQSQQARVAQEEDVRKMESQLRDFADERQLKSTQMEASRKKVNIYLKLLDVAQKRLGGASPQLIRNVQ